jgi:hypothetical protein
MDNEIDARYDTTKSIMDKLYRKAYGEDYPDDLYDFAAHTAISRCEEEESDLHVEWDTKPTMDYTGISEIDDYPPLVHKQERGPSDNDPPFDWGGIEGAFVGTFGPALKSLLKVVAVGNAQGDDMSNLVLYFKRTWGLDDDTDITPLIPHLRSTGPTMLASLNRKLVPFCYAHPAVSGLVRVKFHGVQRKGKLVNWPRIAVIAQFVATMLKMEDNYAPADLSRIDFKIHWDEMPDEPKVKHFDFSKLKPPERGERNLHAIGVVNNIIIEKDKLAKQYMHRQKANVTMDAEIPREVLDRVKFVDIPIHKMKTSFDWDNIPEKELDLTVPRKAPDLTSVKKKKLTNAAALEKVIAAKTFETPTLAGHQLHDLANGVDMGGTDAISTGRGIVEKILGTNGMRTVYLLLRASGDGYADAHEKAIGLLRNAGAKGEVFKETNYVGMQKLALGQNKVLAFFLRKIAESANKHVMLHSNTLVMTKQIARAFKVHNDASEAFRQIVEMRKNWWADRWKQKGKIEGPKRVEYQLKGHWLNIARIEVRADFSVDFSDDGATVVGAICRSVENYLKKREKHPKFKDRKPIAASHDLLSVARQADQVCEAEISYEYVLGRLRHVFVQFKEDIEKIVLADAYGLEDVGIKGDMKEDPAVGTNGDLDQELNILDDDESGSDADMAAEPAQVAPVIRSNFNLFGGDDDDDEDSDPDEEPKIEPNVDLESELYEDLDNPPSDLVPSLVQIYGKIVKMSEYKKILKEATKTVMQAHIRAAPTLGFDDNDID